MVTARTVKVETRDERGRIIRIDVRTVSTLDEFMAAAAALGAEVFPPAQGPGDTVPEGG